MAFYLPSGTAREFRGYLAERDLKISDVIAELVQELLEKQR